MPQHARSGLVSAGVVQLSISRLRSPILLQRARLEPALSHRHSSQTPDGRGSALRLTPRLLTGPQCSCWPARQYEPPRRRLPCNASGSLQHQSSPHCSAELLESLPEKPANRTCFRLDGIVESLTTAEWRELLARLQERDFRCDIVGSLPVELVSHIFRYLPPNAPFQYQQVCGRRWFAAGSSMLTPCIGLPPMATRVVLHTRDWMCA